MYAEHALPASLDGISNTSFAMYWKTIKSRLAELQQLPVWATNHAMKLGITVENLKRMGRTDLVDLLQTEIRKVNDDIAKAWKVKGYIDKYMPEWLKQSAVNELGPVVTVSTPPQYTAASTGWAITPVPNTPTISPQVPATTVKMPGYPVYTQPTAAQQVTGWIKSWFGGGGVSGGLGALPIIIGASALAALAYVVTTGMALYSDYKTKKDLSQSVIEGKLTSGQAADILVASRPAEGLVSTIVGGVGTNIGTLLIVGLVGYGAFLYLGSKKMRGDII